MNEDRHLRGDGAKTGAEADALDAERRRDPELDRAFRDDRDTYERAADAEREAGRAALEAARDDARGVPTCENGDCSRRVHGIGADYCHRCDRELAPGSREAARDDYRGER